jgi:hypothetical protein
MEERLAARLQAALPSRRGLDRRGLPRRQEHPPGAASLAKLFEGHVGKDVVSRFAGSQDGRGGRPEREGQRTRSAWQAWQERDLGGEDVVRLILDGTVVKVRLDRKTTAISLLIALGVRRDGQKARRSAPTTEVGAGARRGSQSGTWAARVRPASEPCWTT